MLYALLAVMILSIWAVILIVIGIFMIIPDIYYRHSKMAKSIKKSFYGMDKDSIIKDCMRSTIFDEYHADLDTFLELEMCKVYIIIYNKIKENNPSIKYIQVENVLSRYFNKNDYIVKSLTKLYEYRKKREKGSRVN